MRASIGISVAEPDAVPESAEELLRNADVAMYLAKEKGKNRYQLFEPAMHDTALKRLELKAALQRALEHNEFRLFYQPVIELESGKVSGVEALIRWFHPERGMVPPLDFIPLAEETGLIVPIGHWVLQEACRYAAELQGRYPWASRCTWPSTCRPGRWRGPSSSTRCGSPRRHRARSLHAGPRDHRVRDDPGYGPRDRPADRAEGARRPLAIDDFGTGYSSLNYVRRFPVDILKVDKSFIDGVTEGGESSALTAAVIELASILSLKPVAEGSSVPTSCSGCWSSSATWARASCSRSRSRRSSWSRCWRIASRWPGRLRRSASRRTDAQPAGTTTFTARPPTVPVTVARASDAHVFHRRCSRASGTPVPVSVTVARSAPE